MISQEKIIQKLIFKMIDYQKNNILHIYSIKKKLKKS